MFFKMLYEDVEVDVNIQSATFIAQQYTSKNPDTQYFDFMSKLADSDDHEKRSRMIDALGCATDEYKSMTFRESSLEKNGF